MLVPLFTMTLQQHNTIALVKQRIEASLLLRKGPRPGPAFRHHCQCEQRKKCTDKKDFEIFESETNVETSQTNVTSRRVPNTFSPSKPQANCFKMTLFVGG
jgi:hypothetical protein